MLPPDFTWREWALAASEPNPFPGLGLCWPTPPSDFLIHFPTLERLFWTGVRRWYRTRGGPPSEKNHDAVELHGAAPSRT